MELKRMTGNINSSEKQGAFLALQLPLPPWFRKLPIMALVA